MNPLDHLAADVIDAILVEAHRNDGHAAIRRHQVAAKQRIAQRALPDRCRLAPVVEQGLDFYAALISGQRVGGKTPYDVGGRQALDAFHRVDTRDVAGQLPDELETLRGEQSIRFERDEQSPLAAEFGAEPVVGLVDGILLRDPHADVVVDLGEVYRGKERQKSGDDRRTQRKAESKNEGRDASAHFAPASSSRREKSSSFKPTL